MYYMVAHSYKEKQTPLYCSKGLTPVYKLIKKCLTAVLKTDSEA